MKYRILVVILVWSNFAKIKNKMMYLRNTWKLSGGSVIWTPRSAPSIILNTFTKLRTPKSAKLKLRDEVAASISILLDLAVRWSNAGFQEQFHLGHQFKEAWMLTMIRDGHRQVGIYQQKVSQIGRRHYRDDRTIDRSFRFYSRSRSIVERGRLSRLSLSTNWYFPFPRWIHHVDFKRPTSPKNCILSVITTTVI